MRQAFSLVELSIVLVILGLLTGGILAGQSLVRASQMRSVSTEYARYTTAVGAFRDKYFALPGDFAKAIDFWGAAHATPLTCRTTVSTGPATCNGDGNNRIDSAIGLSDEYFRLWQHLANAGMIEGSYTGTRDGSSSLSATSRNSPQSKLDNAVWWPYYHGEISGAGTVFNGSYGNTFEFAKPVANDQPYGAVLKPEEAWNIDSKMDDGKPGGGKIVIRCFGDLSYCTTTVNPATLTADYKLDATTAYVSFIFRQQF